MKVLHVIPNVGVGGAERILFDIIRHTKGRYNHRVISMMAGEAFFGLPDIEFTSLGLSRGAISSGAVRRFRSIVRSFTPDVIHAWLYHGNALSVFAFSRAPIIWSIHNTDLPADGSKSVTRAISRISAVFSSLVPKRIIYAGEKSRRIHESLGYARRRGLVVSNGVDLQTFRPNPEDRKSARAEYSATDENFVIGCIGRFDPQKDHGTMIRAFASVRERLHAILVLAGTGCDPSNHALRAMIAAADVEPYVRLLGVRSDIPRLINGLDALAISSRFGEAMPVVALEAAATEVPVVATAVGDVEAFLLDKAHLAQPEDPFSLAAALVSVALSRNSLSNLEAKAELRKRLLSGYTITTMAEAYDSVYQSVVVHQSPAPERLRGLTP